MIEGKPMTQAELDDIRSVEQAATPGPWTDSDGYGDQIFANDDKGMFQVAQVRGWGHFTGKGDGGLGLIDQAARDIQDANSSFIAISRTAVPCLLAEVERLKTALVTYQKAEKDGKLVRVVRCKDCMYANAAKSHPQLNCQNQNSTCYKRRVRGNWYCMDGESAHAALCSEK